MSAGGPILNDQPAQDDTIVQAAVGLADTPLGQRLAVTITVLLGQDNARQLATAIGKTADGMSGSGLIVAAAGTSGVGHAVGQQPS